MKLYLVFLLGFLASVATVGGLIWFFAAYETKDLNPFFHSPRMSQDKWFEIIRNAVTMGAALGVGVTLFFSYRRQQTAEETHRIGIQAQLTAAKAQQTAAEALGLANKQHSLDQDRRKDSVTAELRSRYVQTAEQLGSEHLAIRLAGIYSLAALADDWAEIGNHDERQVCIDLLCAYFRSAGSFADGKMEVMATTLDVVLSRLKQDTSERKHWGGTRIQLVEPVELHSMEGLVLHDGGSLTFQRPSADRHSFFVGNLTLDGGVLEFNHVSDVFSVLQMYRVTLNRGQLRVSFPKDDGSSPDDSAMASLFHATLVFRTLTLDGATMVVNSYGHNVILVDCTFKSGDLFINAGHGSVTFRGCTFEGDVFGHAKRAGATRPVSTPSLVVEDCSFNPGVQILESYEIDPGGWQPAETISVDKNGEVHVWRAEILGPAAQDTD